MITLILQSTHSCCIWWSRFWSPSYRRTESTVAEPPSRSLSSISTFHLRLTGQLMKVKVKRSSESTAHLNLSRPRMFRTDFDWFCTAGRFDQCAGEIALPFFINFALTSSSFAAFATIYFISLVWSLRSHVELRLNLISPKNLLIVSDCFQRIQDDL